MLPTPLPLDPATARRFMRRALLLDQPAPDVASALAHHGYIQIDPINVCGRMHDLILRNRVAGYREGDLMRHLHGDFSAESPLERGLSSVVSAKDDGAQRRGVLSASDRVAFEHHIPTEGTLVAFPLEAWPYLRAEMRRRSHRSGAWSGRLSPKQKELSVRLLTEIAERGPMCSEDFADTGRSRAVWGAATQAKTTLQKLFFHGRLLIAKRSDSNRRYYDLPERVLPARIIKLPEPTRKEIARWETLLKLRQRRLTPLKRTELPLVTNMVQPVAVKGCPTLYLLKSDLPLLAEIQSSKSEISDLKSQIGAALPLLLAPLDPLIYSRPVTSALWEFDYTWEVYTPPAKRKRGYYALPVLSGHALVGHVDPKVDRLAKKLRIQSRAVRRGHAITGPLQDFARWLGVR